MFGKSTRAKKGRFCCQLSVHRCIWAFATSRTVAQGRSASALGDPQGVSTSHRPPAPAFLAIRKGSPHRTGPQRVVAMSPKITQGPSASIAGQSQRIAKLNRAAATRPWGSRKDSRHRTGPQCQCLSLLALISQGSGVAAGAGDSRKREAAFPRRRRLPVLRTKNNQREPVPQVFVK